ncbi:hypothetical protein BD324DRAFT_654907 [Kockovaella imperatae]|uniref:Uncharacterized protein n=1 Tax=Kockovaella imperatae TaxID=4999 RepID=A0A1Y1UQL5_9TREE|nr:hypothetical protein BD324DRAFT_654907 [Kockovaella imperatae]ORX39774.1 hypothetical protein BD324DRAFT_654907 [Kockovaella imperatae]
MHCIAGDAHCVLGVPVLFPELLSSGGLQATIPSATHHAPTRPVDMYHAIERGRRIPQSLGHCVYGIHQILVDVWVHHHSAWPIAGLSHGKSQMLGRVGQSSASASRTGYNAAVRRAPCGFAEAMASTYASSSTSHHRTFTSTSRRKAGKRKKDQEWMQGSAFKLAQAMRDKIEKPLEISSSEPVELPGLVDFRRVLGRPRVRDHKKPYEERKALYEKGFDRVNKAFNVKQLREILGAQSDMLAVSGGPIKKGNKYATKPIIVQQLMENEGWSVPVDERSAHLIVSELLDIPPNELWLFLRDTQYLQRFMIQQGVVFSVVEVEGDMPGVRLKIEGPASAIDQVKYDLKGKRKYMTLSNIDHEDMNGFRLEPALAHFLSLITGAYIESYESGYRVSSMRPASVQSARNLIMLATLRARILPRARPLIALQSPGLEMPLFETRDLALIPFFPSPSYLIPWDSLTTSFAALLFRLKRPAQWHSMSGIPGPSGGPTLANSTVHSIWDPEQARVTLPASFQELHQQIRSRFPSTEQVASTITFGHMLVRQTSSAPESALSPPIRGKMPVEKFAPHLAESFRPVFTPGLVLSAVHSPPTSRTKRMRRLRYRTLDGSRAASFIFTHPAGEHENQITPDDNGQSQNWLSKLDDMLAKMSGSSQPAWLAEERDNASNDNERSSAPDPAPSEDLSDIFDAQFSAIHEIDILMPDHPNDARLSMSSSEVIPQEDIPDDVLSFFDAYTENLTRLKPVDSGALDPHESGQSQPSKPKLLPPPAEITITRGEDDIHLVLEAHEDVEIVEDDIQDKTVVRRLVRVKDMTIGVDRLASHSEVECNGSNFEPFWTEINDSMRYEPEVSLFLPPRWTSWSSY